MVFNTHSMNIAVAVKYGAPAALVLEQINSWINYNQTNNKNFYYGRYWTYNSVKAWSDLIPYFTYEQIRKILRDLEKSGLIIKGNHNKHALDKTLWYSITDKGYDELKATFTICEKTQIDMCENTNASVESHTCNCAETQSNTIIKTINKTNIKEKDIDSVPSSISKEKKRFSGVNPSKEEVEAYIREKGFHVSADSIISYYTNAGDFDAWRFKNGSLVRDWKRCVITCERNLTPHDSANHRLKDYNVEEDEDAIRSKAFMKKLMEEQEKEVNNAACL